MGTFLWTLLLLLSSSWRTQPMHSLQLRSWVCCCLSCRCSGWLVSWEQESASSVNMDHLSHPWGVSAPSHILTNTTALLIGCSGPLAHHMAVKHCSPTGAGDRPSGDTCSTQANYFICLSSASCPFCAFSILSCEFLSSFQVLFLFKCHPSTAALWRTSPPWRHCCRCRGCWAARHWWAAMDLGPFEKRGVLHQRDEVEDLRHVLGSGRRSLDSKSPELILLNWFLFIQWKPLRIEISFPNLNLLTDLWITVDICQFW